MAIFHRTVFEVEVLSEDPVPADLDLDDIAEEITTGSYSGKVTREAEEVVDGPTMARLLQEQGSDPEFFGLDAEGNEIEEA